MSAAAPSIGRHELETLIIERAWKHPDFRREFVADPKGTFEKYAGQKLPENLKISVHEEDAATMHITIPVAPANLSELSDEDLERVAGGTDVVSLVVSIAVSVSLSVGGTAAVAVTRGQGW